MSATPQLLTVNSWCPLAAFCSCSRDQYKQDSRAAKEHRMLNKTRGSADESACFRWHINLKMSHLQNTSSDDDDEMACLQAAQDEEFDDWNDDDEAEPTPSLFEPQNVCPSVEAALDYDANKHGFDLRVFIMQASTLE